MTSHVTAELYNLAEGPTIISLVHLKDVTHGLSGDNGLGSDGTPVMVRSILNDTFHDRVNTLQINETVYVNPGDMLLLCVGSGGDASSDIMGVKNFVIGPCDLRESSCADLSTFLPIDLNEDCYVNLEDFAEFAKDWLKCNDPANPVIPN